MTVASIRAEKDEIVFELCGAETLQDCERVYVKAFSPATTDIVAIANIPSAVSGGTVRIDRNIGGRDGAVMRFEVTAGGSALPGKQYVEDFAYSVRTFDYPVTDTKKGLQVSDAEDAKRLGVKHSAININEGNFLMEFPEEGNTIEYEMDCQKFYFRKSAVENADHIVKTLTDIGVTVTFILLNCRHWNVEISDSFWEKIKHPGYEPDGRISQFNLETDEGVQYYRAFISFVAERYTREDKLYGNAVGMIVGNEVNSGVEWYNGGNMPFDHFSKAYTEALRLTWQTACAVYKNMRIYISLDHFWNSMMMNNPERYYKTTDLLEEINRLAKEEGEIPWNIAHHPYPEDLNHPEFWNDANAPATLDAPIITFKNLEMLPLYLSQERFLYRGERRRIILSEQGFNSYWTAASEILQACAYGRAYRKVMEIPEIDSFILHAHRDNKLEFGLNLGLWRRTEDPNVYQEKPVYYLFMEIDKKDKWGKYNWERF